MPQRVRRIAAFVAVHRVEIDVELEIRVFLADLPTRLAQVLVGIDGHIGRHRIGDALHHDLAGFFAVDPVLYERISLVGDEDITRGSRRFEAGGEVHAATDDGVVHPVLAAEVSHRAVPRVYSYAALQRFLDPRPPPDLMKLAQSFLHGDRHLDAGEGIFLHAPCLGIAEKDDDGVADILVDGRAEIEGNAGHLGEILVEQLGQIFGFQSIGRLGEPRDVREEYGQLLAAARDLHLLLAAEDRLIDLRREILRELVGKLLQGI